jgi:hypothetical protein
MCERYSSRQGYSSGSLQIDSSVDWRHRVSVQELWRKHCNFSVRKGDQCPNQKSAAKPWHPHRHPTPTDSPQRHGRGQGTPPSEASSFELRDSRSLGQQAVVIRGAAQRATHQSSLHLFPPARLSPLVTLHTYPSSLISNCMPRAAGLASDQQLPVDTDVPCDWTGAFEGFHRPDTHGILAPLRQTRDGEMRIRIRIRACSPQSVRGQRQNLQRHADGIGRCMLPSLKNGASEETRSGRGPRGMAVSTVFISQCLSAL